MPSKKQGTVTSGGDGVVNLPDFAVFANRAYHHPRTGTQNVISLSSGDGIVDIGDLAVFTEQWLKFKLIRFGGAIRLRRIKPRPVNI